MTIMIRDAELEQRLRAERAACGADRYDEVWEGVYMMSSMPNDEHQMLVGRWTRVLDEIVTDSGLGQVRPGVNVSDRIENWQENYRVPDGAVFLNGSPAVNHSSFWLGGPDLAIEVISPGEQPTEKLDFYAAVAVRELLVIQRDPWRLEQYRLTDSELQLVTRSAVGDETRLSFLAVPIDCVLADGPKRPQIQVTDRDTGRDWTI